MSQHSYSFYVYIMASGRNGTLYAGVTNDIERRIYEHKHNELEGFTRKYGVHTLVYYEHFTQIRDAIDYEKVIKGKSRAWKIALIEKENYHWQDLAQKWYDKSDESD